MNEANSDQQVRERAIGLRERIAAAAKRAGRDPGEITLLGVCKRQSNQRIASAVRAGVVHLAENYIQEARDRRGEVEALLAAGPTAASPNWHFVGSLQRNKARHAASLFDWVQSLDSEKLALELDRQAERTSRRLSLCIQVNLSEEAQKGGVPITEVRGLLRSCAGLANLDIRGLMAIPAVAADAELMRPAFARLRELRDELQGCEGARTLRDLSMGMSGDFEVAVEEGATIVRIGTALFGPRGD